MRYVDLTVGERYLHRGPNQHVGREIEFVGSAGSQALVRYLDGDERTVPFGSIRPLDEPDDDVLLGHAEIQLGRALRQLRMITPEAWEHAAAHALLEAGWHTSDVSLLRDARLLSMRGGPRFKPPTSSSER